MNPLVFRSLHRARRRFLFPVLDVLLPSRCGACGGRLGPDQHRGLCPSCWADLPLLVPPLCRECGLPLPSVTDLVEGAARRCGPCAREPWGLDGIRAAVAYEGTGRRILVMAKFHGWRELFEPMAVRLARALELSDVARSVSCLVAVPSHPVTLVRRGFNPAGELARILSRRLGLPVARGVLRRRLVRLRTVRGQSRAGRRRAARETFLAVRSVDRRSRILLVDDVVTTGATVRACASALRDAGAARVAVAAWARTPPCPIMRDSLCP